MHDRAPGVIGTRDEILASRRRLDAPPVVRAEGVEKVYGERVRTLALRGVDLTLEPGEFCALVGPSGCGKSTLLNILGLLDHPTGGRVVLDGHDTVPLDDHARTRLRAEVLGFVFQFHHLLMAFTAVENVAMPLFAREGRRRPAALAHAHALLDRVGLAHRAHHPATDLSGGEQQRVAVARALAMDPLLVLADEPTGNLDTQSSDRVMELLREINEERHTAFLIVTHDTSIAEACRRVVRMRDGRIESDTVRS